MIIKKSITKKVVQRAYKLLVQQNGEFKQKKDEILDTVSRILNKDAEVTIFGKLANNSDNKDKIEKLIEKVKASMPKKKLEEGGNVTKQVTTMPRHLELYHKMPNSDGYALIFI